MIQTGYTLISYVRMAEYGSLRILLRQTMTMIFPFHHLQPSRPLKRYICQALLQKWTCGLTASGQSYHLLLIVIPVMEFTTLLFQSFHLLIAWEILTIKFVYKYKKAAFIARESSLNYSALSDIVCWLQVYVWWL